MFRLKITMVQSLGGGGETPLHKNNAKATEFSVESGGVKVAEFNYIFNIMVKL